LEKKTRKTGYKCGKIVSKLGYTNGGRSDGSE
jgi:hypothetical protein